MPGLAVVLSCEHAGNRVPTAYAPLFATAAAQRALASHRGFDAGAAAMARALGRALGVPALCHPVSRLLVEPNRSPGHRALLSAWSARLDPRARQELLARHYFPHRGRVERALRAELGRGRRVLHVAVHSFTPVLGGVVRRGSVGLLYDPTRPAEAALARHWQVDLVRRLPGLAVRRNHPYRGAADGLTTFLRRILGPRYLGFELELNQADLARPARNRQLLAGLRASLEQILRS